MKRVIVTLLLIISSLTVAQSRGSEFVTVKSFLDVDKVRLGGEFRIAVVVHVKEGYHIQAHNPPEGFIATTFSVEVPKGFKVVRLWYPPAEVKELLGQKLPLYDDTQIFVAVIRAEKSVKLGKSALTLKFRYQACDAKTCYPPRIVTMTIPVEVVPPETPIRFINESVFEKLSKDLKIAPVGEGGEKLTHSGIGEKIANALRSGSIVWALILVSIGGLLMNLSPCVFPMIPIVIGYFGQQSGGKFLQRISLGVAFLSGLMVMYSTIGLIAALTKTMFGSFLQNPWVLLAVTIVLFALSLSMFGLFEFAVPQSAAAAFQKGVELVGAPKFLLKLVGAFSMGLLIGVVAAPCVGPVVIALLGTAPILDRSTLFFLFVALAFGLGLPYFLLAIFMGMVQRIKSGVWNLWVNRFFGIVLLAGAIYFGYQTVYAFGLLRAKHPWQPYSPAALERAIEQGKPVVIDFWAAWCLACKELEHKTFSDPRVKERLRGFVTLQVDMTTGKDRVAKEARERFKVRGLPTVIFIGRDGKERRDLRLEGFEPPESFLRRLDQIQ